MKLVLPPSVTVLLGLSLSVLPFSGQAQTATPTPPAPLPTPIFSPTPASGIVAKINPGEVSHLRRLVRDVVSNTDNIRAAGNFGAQLWLTANGDFNQDWRKPQEPSIEPVEFAVRGTPIFTVVIFYGAGRTPAGLANVSYDMTIFRPDGTIYNRRDAMVGFQNLAPTDDRELQLGRNFLNITIGPDDPVGLYTVNVTVHDNVSRVDLPLKQTFVVQ